jgi:hypothetical protein
MFIHLFRKVAWTLVTFVAEMGILVPVVKIVKGIIVVQAARFFALIPFNWLPAACRMVPHVATT